MTDEDDLIVSQKKILEQIRFSDSRILHPEISVERMADDAKHLLLRVEAAIYGDKVAKDSYTRSAGVSFPTSPWQFFKQRHQTSWWLGWLVRRRPVQVDRQSLVVIVEVERFLLYPELEVRGAGKPVIFESVRVDRKRLLQ